MRLVIEANDFRRLSSEMQRELVKQLAGKDLTAAPVATKKSPYRWSAPIDLSPELAMQLTHGLASDHRRRLALFAKRNGRVTMRQLLKVTEEEDWRVLSYFQSVITRKLRRILGDRERKVYLIGWDYDSTKWDRKHNQILDGTYFVSPQTTETLRSHFHAG